MSSQVLLTPVDEMVTFIKSNPRVSLSVISKTFKIKEDTIEKWVTVLDEQKILRVEYVGLDSVVSFVHKKNAKKKIEIDQIKDLFVQSCYKRGVSTIQMKTLWKSFFEKYEPDIKKQFEEDSVKKGFDKKKIPLAWSRFRKTLEEL